MHARTHARTHAHMHARTHARTHQTAGIRTPLMRARSCVFVQNSVPEWQGAPVSLFRLKKTGPVFAVQDACPHVAIGELSQGEAADVGDIEDYATSTCTAAVAWCAPNTASSPLSLPRRTLRLRSPVHTFVFDLHTGHCVTDSRTPPARIYATKLTGDGRVLVQCKPLAQQQRRATIEDGHRMQMLLVEQGLDRVYGK
jgi:nitrite reductase/ring-hydroxylating ferredoxin subunit